MRAAQRAEVSKGLILVALISTPAYLSPPSRLPSNPPAMPSAAPVAATPPALAVLENMGLYRGGRSWIEAAVSQLKRRRDELEAGGPSSRAAEMPFGNASEVIGREGSSLIGSGSYRGPRKPARPPPATGTGAIRTVN